MKAIILAAGRGSRLKELTDDKPKGMVALCGRSLVERMIDSLHGAGIHDIALVTGYKKECFDFLKLKTFCNENWSSTNMVLSLMCAREYLREGPVLVCYSDIFVSSSALSDLTTAEGSLCVSYDVNWLGLWRERNEDPLQDAETFRINDGKIVEIGQKPKCIDDIQGQYMGLLKFTPQVWGLFEKIVMALADEVRCKISMTEVLQLLIENGQEIVGVPYDGVWGEVDTAEDLKLYESKMQAGYYKGCM